MQRVIDTWRTTIRSMWGLIGIGCFFGWFFLVIRSPFHLDRGTLELFVGLGFLLGSIVENLPSCTIRSARYIRLITIACTVSTLALPIVFPSPFLYPLAFVSSFFATSQCLLWCRLLALSTSEKTYCHIAASIVLARICALLGELSPWICWPLAAAVVILSGITLMRHQSFFDLPRNTDKETSNRARKLDRRGVVVAATCMLFLGFSFPAVKGSIRPDSPLFFFAVLAISLVLLLFVSLSSKNALSGAIKVCLCSLGIGSLLLLAPNDQLNITGRALYVALQQFIVCLVLLLSPQITARIRNLPPVTFFAWPFAVFYLSAAFCKAIGFQALLGSWWFLMPLLTGIISLIVGIVLFNERAVEAFQCKRNRQAADAIANIDAISCDFAQSHGLSHREAQVLSLWIRGLSASIIASNLGITESTVRAHLRGIYRKTGIDGRQNLISAIFSANLENETASCAPRSTDERPNRDV